MEGEANVVVPSDHPLMAWIMDHSATLLKLFKRAAGDDTCTAIHRLRGRPWKIAIPPFGELVEYQRRGLGKMDKRYGLCMSVYTSYRGPYTTFTKVFI